MHSFHWPYRGDSRFHIHHNGDYSGDATLVSNSGEEFTIPVECLSEFVAEMVRDKLTGEIESCDTPLLLRLLALTTSEAPEAAAASPEAQSPT